MRSPQPLPTTGGTETEVALARQFGRLMGPWFHAADGTRNAADALAFGMAIGDARSTTVASGLEAYVNLATYLLTEYETLYRITSRATSTDDRRAALLARARAGFVGAPRTIATAILSVAGTSAAVIETVWSDVTAQPRNVHTIVVAMDPNVYGTPPTYTAPFFEVKAVAERMKPAHVKAVYTGTQTDGFLTDDPNSLTDNTVLRT